MNRDTNLMSVVFAFPLAMSLLLQGGSCNQKSEHSNPASVKPDKAATNRNGSTIESSSSNRNAAVERGAANDNKRKDEPGMKQADEGSGAGRERRSVEAGTWGGAHIRLQVSASGAEVEYDCGHGTIEKMTLDGDGQFDVRGTHIRERGGPVRLGQEANSSLPARYTGKVEGQTMTLRVTLTGTGEEAGAFKLTHGTTARLFKCL